MSDTTIDGFTLSVPGAELIEMCKKKVDHLTVRLGQLEESHKRVKEMAPEDRALAGFKTSGGDMADEVAKKRRDAEKDLRYFNFCWEHLESDATYRLDKDDLRVFGIAPTYR